MPYTVLYRGVAIGETDFERSVDQNLRGTFRPAAGFREAEPSLRPYGTALREEMLDDRGRVLDVRWSADDGRSLPPLELTLLDPRGQVVSAQHVRLHWPGDFPGIRALEVHAWGTVFPRGGSQPT